MWNVGQQRPSSNGDGTPVPFSVQTETFLRNYTIKMRHLYYFVVVAEELSFKRAAERLKVHQPQLSRQIKTFEDALGVRLFEREGRAKVTMTVAGTVCLLEARQLLAQVEAATQRVRDAACGEGGSLVIANYSAVATRLLTACLQEYRQLLPKVPVSIVEMGGAEQLTALQNGKIDVAIQADFETPEKSAFRSLVLGTLPIVTMFANTHPLARVSGPEIEIQALADHVLLWPAEESGASFNQRMIEVFGRIGFAPRGLQRVEGLANVFSMVSAGYGVAILPEAFDTVPVASIQKKRIRLPLPPFQLQVLWIPKTSTPAIEQFLVVVRKVIASFHARGVATI